MAKIVVNTRFLVKNKLEGIGRFTFEVLKRITKNHPEHQFYFLFDRQWDNEFIFSSNVIPLKIGPQARHPFLWYLWFEYSLPAAIKRINPDLLLSTDGFTTLKSDVKKITVFHDLAFEHYPKDINWLVRIFYKTFTPQYAKLSNRISTVSEYSKNDLISTYGINKNKIDVVYNGANEYFKPSNFDIINKLKKDFTNDNDFFCFVGALHPRKNIINLLKAFDAFKRNDKNNIKLAIVGRKAWKSNEIVKIYNAMKFKNDVIFTGFLKHEKIAEIYSASLGLVYIPYFEGFGIPIIEAQQCKCPVITSNTSSMPEVAGNGAILVNPFQVNEISASMHNLLNKAIRDELIAKGDDNCKRFSWDLTAKKLWKSIEEVLNDN